MGRLGAWGTAGANGYEMKWFCISKAEVSRQHARLNLMTCAQRRLVFMGMVVAFCFFVFVFRAVFCHFARGHPTYEVAGATLRNSHSFRVLERWSEQVLV